MDTSGPRIQHPGGGEGIRHLTRSIYLALMGMVFSVVGLIVLWKLRPLLILLFVSLLIACSMASPVAKLHKLGVPKAWSVLGMYFVVGTLLAVLGWFALPAFIGQGSQFVDQLPQHIDKLERLQGRLTEVGREYPQLQGIDQRLTDLAASFGSSIGRVILHLPALMAETILVVTSLMTLSLLMVVSWDKMKPVILELVHPRNRELADDVMSRIGSRLGAYLRAKVIMMTIIGLWVYTTLFLLDVPFAVLASILAALCEIVPRIGPLFGRLIIVVFAVAVGWIPAVIVLVSHTVISEIKGSWLSPLIEGNQLDIHPMTALIAVLAGALLMGWMGALIAVPAAAAAQVVVELVVIPWRKHQLASSPEPPLIDVGRDSERGKFAAALSDDPD